MRSISAVFFGFGLSLFLEGFARIIISFFHTLEPAFFGIQALPGTAWIITMYVVSLISSWMGAMIAMTIAGFAPNKHLIAFITLLLLWTLFETLSSLTVSPAWYLITFPLCSLAGAFLAGYTYKLNLEHATHTS